MQGHSAELKMTVQRKDFLRLYKKLLQRDRNDLDLEMKEQIVYFADTTELDFYQKNHVALRYRRSNRGLEVIVKKRGVTEQEYKKLFKKFGNLLDHEFKVDIDQISDAQKTFSCVLRHTFNSMHQSFPFYHSPEELLTDAQKQFVKKFVRKELKGLKFLIPIQSKTFIFPYEYKEFSTLSLEERRMPKLFGNKFYEVTAKTLVYEKKTVHHFLALCKELDIETRAGGMFKTQWLYDSYFNV